MNSQIESCSTIGRLMPQYRLRQIDRIRVQSSPAVAWPIVREIDTYELPISRFLFNLRTAPEKFLQIFKGQKPKNIEHSKINDFTGPGKGFQILAEIPGQEITIGSIGKFWQTSIEFANFTEKTFSSFQEDGYGKLAWTLRLDPDSHGGSWLSWELRITATDEPSWRKFRRYWFVIGKFSHLLRKVALRHFHEKLGPVVEENLKLPGDQFLDHPVYQKTMSQVIEVPPEKLWPWLVQMGCQRAGWYSLDWLDNANIKSATEILPEFQNIRIGDTLPWKPKGREGFAVLDFVPERSLILGSRSLLAKGGTKFNDEPVVDSWAFVLEPIGSDATYLSTRVRAEMKPGEKNLALQSFLEAAHVIMESAQLKNLKQRAESKA